MQEAFPLLSPHPRPVRLPCCPARAADPPSHLLPVPPPPPPPPTPAPSPPLQLLRGLATGMKVSEFSSAKQWGPYARQAVKQLQGVPLPTQPGALDGYIHPL